MKAFAVAVFLVIATPSGAWDGQAIQSDTLLSPVSRTAMDAGTLYLTDFIGGPKVTAGNAEAGLRLIGTYWRDWDGDGRKDTADLFAVTSSFRPICDGAASFMAVHRTVNGYGVSAFSGSTPPRDVNSAGLCATYSFD